MNKLTINKMCSHMYVHREGQTHSNYCPPDTPSFEDQPIGNHRDSCKKLYPQCLYWYTQFLHSLDFEEHHNLI